jgi:hypothetical protein
MVLQLDEFKMRQRVVWDAGEYSALSPYIADVGELVLAGGGIEPGMKVLDDSAILKRFCRPFS